MNNAPSITEAELEVMKLLWENSPLTASEIIAQLSDKMDWSSQTIKTFLNRLLNKEVIGFQKEGRNYLYYPLVSKDEHLKTENKSFLKQFYNGAVSLLFSKFLEEENISDEEIEKLQDLLEKKKKQR